MITNSTNIEDNVFFGGDEFLLHASSVVINGRALIFIGHSTSGKSTIARLLSEKYSVISDDKISVFKTRNTWFIKKGDKDRRTLSYKPSTPVASGTFPILAFVRIFQSNYNNLEQISSELLCKFIADAVFEIDFQRKRTDIEQRKQLFYLSSELAKKYNGWQFFFRKEISIINIIKKNF